MITFSLWAEDDDMTAVVETFPMLNTINWNTDHILMYYEECKPHLILPNYVNSITKEKSVEISIWPCYQFILPIKDALNYEIRYSFISLIELFSFSD